MRAVIQQLSGQRSFQVISSPDDSRVEFVMDGDSFENLLALSSILDRNGLVVDDHMWVGGGLKVFVRRVED